MTVWCSKTWFSTEPRLYFFAPPEAGSHFHRLRDGNAQGAVVFRVLGQQAAAIFRAVGRAGKDLCAESLHVDAAVGLLVVRDLDHVNFQVHAEEIAGHGQRSAPLAGPGLGGDGFRPGDLVVKSLRDGGIRLVAAHRRNGLILEIDVGGGIEHLFQAARPHQRGGTVQLVDLPHFLRDLDIALAADFLHDQFHREEHGQEIRRDRFLGHRVQYGRRRHRAVGIHVVPKFWQVGFIQHKTGLVRHGLAPLGL